MRNDTYRNLWLINVNCDLFFPSISGPVTPWSPDQMPIPQISSVYGWIASSFTVHLMRSALSTMFLSSGDINASWVVWASPRPRLLWLEMASLLQPDRVVYLVRGEKKLRAPLSQLYFCRYCSELRSLECVSHEVGERFHLNSEFAKLAVSIIWSAATLLLAGLLASASGRDQ